jgi:hypothetical protein
MNGIFCDYDTGMFSLEPEDETEIAQFFKHETEKQRIAYHEAGHAVLNYALGLGLSRITLRTTIREDDDHELIVAYHGITISPKLDVHMHGRRLGSDLIAYGISTAAGAAAERKWCVIRETPLTIRNGSDGDHASIERVGDMLEKNGRNRFAFRRMIWRRAQLALSDRTIWGAVEQLADYLNDSCWPGDEEIGTHEDGLSGRQARAFLKKAGIDPDIERPRILGAC